MAPKRVVSRSTADSPSAVAAAASSSASTSKPAPVISPSAIAKKQSVVSTNAGFFSSLNGLWSSYLDTTPKNLKLLDSLQLFLMLTGIAQFVYCLTITNYPFNAFLGGFSATVGQFVLTASLRSQVNPANKEVFPTISPERAFADFVFGSLILHFFVYNYLG
ncbi:DAD family-domain-containing protein [Leucosporidium creatinivorum]|uniref:Dolichyl-diphosphooligosaccharide--protein glycosyltransferase subunit OST2 n=1 Tax=Leucosporidium creatinivorum TaxID=106004 RepID=A0A1Y2DBB1_9BASI|nr:DAD family-domain-containing protein [Leucosporidium creatinivorum]